MMVTPTTGQAFHDRAKMNGERDEWMKDARPVIREWLQRTVPGRRGEDSRKQEEEGKYSIS